MLTRVAIASAAFAEEPPTALRLLERPGRAAMPCRHPPEAIAYSAGWFCVTGVASIDRTPSRKPGQDSCDSSRRQARGADPYLQAALSRLGRGGYHPSECRIWRNILSKPSVCSPL
jgi:hypothetical protein